MSEVATDQEWQRLDPRMLLIHPVREVIRFLPPLAGLFIAGTASGGRGWQFLGILVPIALGLLRYLTTSFRIASGRVELKRGLLNTHVLSTPIDRVRTVDLTSTLIHRALGLTTVRIGTGTSTSTGEDDLDLDGLPVDRARALRADLLSLSTAEDLPPGEAPIVDQRIVHLDLGWARFAPLTSSGVVVTAGLLGVGSQVLNSLDLFERIRPGDWDFGVPGWTVIVAALFVLAVLVVAISVAGYLVTNWNFVLTRAPGSFHLSRGLLTTRETTLDEVRVAGVTVSEPIGLRLAGGARLSAIVTGLDAGQSGSSTLVPPAPVTVVRDVAGLVLGTATPPATTLLSHGSAARQRRYTRAVGPAVVLVGLTFGVVLLAGWDWWTALPSVLVLPAAMALAASRTRALGHRLCEGYVVARSGSILRNRDHLAVDHVIGWNFRATWFQRRKGLTSLVATMAGGRQSVTVLDVPQGDAVALADATLPHVVRQFLA